MVPVKPIARRLRSATLVIALMATIGGCTTPVGPSYPPRSQLPAPLPPAPTQPQPAPTRPQATPPVITRPQPDTPATPRPAPSVTLALVQQSDAARGRGYYDQAIALLERAIRIEPDRPDLWVGLATIHLEQGDYDAAEQLARKSLLFTGKRYDVEQRAWSVIGAAEAARRQDRRL